MKKIRYKNLKGIFNIYKKHTTQTNTFLLVRNEKSKSKNDFQIIDISWVIIFNWITKDIENIFELALYFIAINNKIYPTKNFETLVEISKKTHWDYIIF